jgi:DNA modification methylase
LSDKIVLRQVSSLRPSPNNPRSHPEAQIQALMKSISHIWTNPIVVDEKDVVLFGHARLEAAKHLGMKAVPTLTLWGLSASEKRTVVIADNRLSELSVWNFDLLRKEFNDLIEIDADVELTGFTTGEIDILLDGEPAKPESADPLDECDTALAGPPVTIVGDVWQLGRHRLVCADALDRATYATLLGRERAQMVVTDPPYNVRISGHARGRGKKRQREFPMASGEMSEAEYTSFLETGMSRASAASTNGSIHYWFSDWRHLPEFHSAGRATYSELKNILVWNKTNAGQGSFYRSKHEMILVYKNGTAAHINNFGMGQHGRYRTNVLDYPGVNALIAPRKEEMDAHPTVKPVALFADLMRDCSKRNGIILDPFAGSGTVILAADRAGRIARAIEIDPLYVDLAIRRWERATGNGAVHASGKTFAELGEERASAIPVARSTAKGAR